LGLFFFIFLDKSKYLEVPFAFLLVANAKNKAVFL